MHHRTKHSRFARAAFGAGEIPFGPSSAAGPFGPQFGFGPHSGPHSHGRGGFGSHSHSRGGGFGPQGGGFGPPAGGGRGRRRRGDVRSALLLLLGEEPRNGYQLMQEVEERSGGRWRPSPGAVYPSLAQLEDEGLIRATERDGTRVFELTDQGRKHLEERPDQPAPWDEGEGSEGFRGLRTEGRALLIAARQVAQAGDRGQIERATQTLAEARRALYRILAEEPGE